MGKINIKKNLLTISLLSSGFVFANTYNVIISSNHNDFEIIDGYKTIEYTNWVDIGSKSCSFDKETSDVYYNKDFTQTESCDQSQERTKTEYYTDIDGNKKVISTETESQVITTTNSNLEKGTHLESTCKDILSVDSGKYNSGDGLYHLSQSGTPEVYCDMTRNGGGWMRVSNYDWYNNPNNIPNSGFDSTKNKVIIDTVSNPYPVVDAFWVKDWTSSASPTSQRWKNVDVTPLHAWSESMIDFEGWAFRSLDGFHPAKSLSSNISGQYMDGFSIAYIKNGTRNHLYSIPVGYENDSDGRALLTWLPDSEFTYFPMGTHEPGWAFNRKVSMADNNAILTKVKSESRDTISLRLMADQFVNDETIGFRKFIVWVR